MYLSVITVGSCYEFKEEMLIPKVIGNINRFVHNTHSVRKLLPLGHRWRGDVDVI